MISHTTRRWLVLSASLLVAVACSGDASGGTSTTTTATAGTTSTSASSTDPIVRSIDASVIGGGNYPGFTVHAPSPWSTIDGYFVINHTGGVMLGLSVWDVGRVPRNPCHWQSSMGHPGPTVDDLVSALVGQEMRNATTPTDVTLGGYRGRYLEWSVPAHMVVTGDSNFAGCDVFPSNGQRDFASWFSDGGGGERYQQMAGQVDMLWVLDVDGQRLLVDAAYSPNATQAERHALVNIAKSLTFN